LTTINVKLENIPDGIETEYSIPLNLTLNEDPFLSLCGIIVPDYVDASCTLQGIEIARCKLSSKPIKVKTLSMEIIPLPKDWKITKLETLNLKLKPSSSSAFKPLHICLLATIGSTSILIINITGSIVSSIPYLASRALTQTLPPIFMHTLARIVFKEMK